MLAEHRRKQGFPHETAWFMRSVANGVRSELWDTLPSVTYANYGLTSRDDASATLGIEAEVAILKHIYRFHQPSGVTNLIRQHQFLIEPLFALHGYLSEMLRGKLQEFILEEVVDPEEAFSCLSVTAHADVTAEEALEAMDAFDEWWLAAQSQRVDRLLIVLVVPA